MKRIGITAVAIVLVAAVLVSAGWNEVPDDLYSTVFISDWQGTRETMVAFSDWSLEFILALLDETDRANTEAMYEMVDVICENKWGDGFRAIYVYVSPMTGHEGDTYFWPTNIVFGQDNRAWEISYEDCIAGFTDSFSGRVYGIMDGFIVLPEQLDTTREFTIWYDDQKTTLGPIY